ncbi:MAG: restriction endonuclease [Halodesulfurarchaeum sp.]
MVADLDDREFAEMLGDIWERYDWTVEVTERDGVFVVAGEKPDGRRGLILVAPGDAGPVGADRLETLDSLRTERGIDVPVAATRSSFDEEAQEMAEINGLHLVDPETLEESASAKGFEDLLAKYSERSLLGRVLGLLARIPLGPISIPRPGIPSVGGNVGVVVAGAVAVLVLVVLGAGIVEETLGDLLAGLPIPGIGAIGGLLGGLPIPDFGLLDAIGGFLGALPLPDIGLGGGGYSVTAVSLTQDDATPVTVGWDAKRQDQVVGPNGTAFEAPENHSFVVVQLNATNPTGDTVVLEPSAFALATGETRYGPQTLDGAEGGLPIVLPPLESTEGYLVFSVPEDSEAGTLLALPGRELPIEFERDRSLEYQVQ